MLIEASKICLKHELSIQRRYLHRFYSLLCIQQSGVLTPNYRCVIISFVYFFRWITPVSLFLYFFSDFYLGVFPLLDTPNIPYDVLIDEGDLNLGALYSVRDRSGDINDPCGGPIQNARLQQNIEAIVYTINKVNADDPIHRYVHVIICNVLVL